MFGVATPIKPKITLKLSELINPTITSSDVCYTTHFLEH